MPIHVQCLNCGKKLTAKDELAGKNATCPSCGKVMVVPSALLASPGMLTDQAAAKHAIVTAVHTTSEPRHSAPQDKPTVLRRCVGGGVAVLAVIVVLSAIVIVSHRNKWDRWGCVMPAIAGQPCQDAARHTRLVQLEITFDVPGDKEPYHLCGGVGLTADDYISSVLAFSGLHVPPKDESANAVITLKMRGQPIAAKYSYKTNLPWQGGVNVATAGVDAESYCRFSLPGCEPVISTSRDHQDPPKEIQVPQFGFGQSSRWEDQRDIVSVGGCALGCGSRSLLVCLFKADSNRIQVLLDRLAREDDKNSFARSVHGQAWDAMLEIGTPLLPLFVRLLADPDPRFCETASKVISRLSAKESDPATRQAVVAALETACEDKDPRIRTAAKKKLENGIGGAKLWEDRKIPWCFSRKR